MLFKMDQVPDIIEISNNNESNIESIIERMRGQVPSLRLSKPTFTVKTINKLEPNDIGSVTVNNMELSSTHRLQLEQKFNVQEYCSGKQISAITFISDMKALFHLKHVHGYSHPSIYRNLLQISKTGVVEDSKSLSDLRAVVCFENGSTYPIFSELKDIHPDIKIEKTEDKESVTRINMNITSAAPTLDGNIAVLQSKNCQNFSERQPKSPVHHHSIRSAETIQNCLPK